MWGKGVFLIEIKWWMKRCNHSRTENISFPMSFEMNSIFFRKQWVEHMYYFEMYGLVFEIFTASFDIKWKFSMGILWKYNVKMNMSFFLGAYFQPKSGFRCVFLNNNTPYEISLYKSQIFHSIFMNQYRIVFRNQDNSTLTLQINGFSYQWRFFTHQSSSSSSSSCEVLSDEHLVNDKLLHMLKHCTLLIHMRL